MNLSGAADSTSRGPGRGQVRPPGIWSPTTGSSKPVRPRHVDNRVAPLARHRPGVEVGSAFLGWLTSVGAASLLVSLLAGAGTAVGLAAADESGRVAPAATGSAAPGDAAASIGAAGGSAVAAISLVAYFCGGYVAARMARSFGARQGLAVWLWGVAGTLALAAVAAPAGARDSALTTLNLPRVPVDEGTLTTGGILTLVVSVLMSLAGALLGGAAGTRHRRGDPPR